MDREKEDHYIRRLRSDIEVALGWGKASEWHSSMFDDLSEKIFRSLQVMLSSTTLKRFFNILKYKGSPSISTLNTLSQFLGFENWSAYKLSKKEKFLWLKKGLVSNINYVVAGFVLATIFLMFIANKQRLNPGLKKDFSFSSRTIDSSFPNSVVFDLELHDIKTNNIRIQQYWDKTKTIELDGSQKQATGIYYFPGYFRAKLLVDDKIVQEEDLFLKSNGWLGTIEYQPIPKYFNPVSDSNKRLSYSSHVKEEVSSSTSPLETVFHYVDDLGAVSGDTFGFQAIVQNTFAEKWAVCQSLKIYILGTKGAMIFPFSKKGCSSDNNVMLSEVYLNGKEYDLSSFGTGLGDPTEIEIKNHNKEIEIKIDEKVIFTRSYQESMGKLVGLRFRFLGLGEVNQIQLLDQTGKKVNLENN